MRRDAELMSRVDVEDFPRGSVRAIALVEGKLGIGSPLLEDAHGQVSGISAPGKKIRKNGRRPKGCVGAHQRYVVD